MVVVVVQKSASGESSFKGTFTKLFVFNTLFTSNL